MIRENKAVPILLVLTLAFLLYLGGCFGTAEPETAQEEAPPSSVVAAPTAAPIVSPEIDAPSEEAFFHTVEDGDRLGSIATKYNVTADVIIRANPQLDPDTIIVGQQLRIPGAGTNNEVLEDVGPDRADGVVVNHVIEPGDTLGDLSVEWTVTIDALLEANPEVDPSNLQVNQILVIPAWGTGYAADELRPRTTPVPVERAPNQILEHIVEPGDSVAALAQLYQVTPQQIVDANGLENGGNSIQVNDSLLIPPPKAEPTAEADSEG